MSERRITARRDGGWPDNNLELGHGRSFGPELKFERGLTVQELLRIFRRRKRLIAIMLVTLNVVGYVAMQDIKPRYTAETSLMIGARQADLLDVRAVLAGLGGESEVIESEVQMLRSRKVLRQVAQQLQLENRPEFDQKQKAPGMLSGLGEQWAVARALAIRHWNAVAPARFRWTQPALETSAEVVTPADPLAIITDEMSRRLSIAPKGRSRVVTVAFEAGDPSLAASVANAIGSTYIADQLNTKRDATANAHQWLEDRMVEMREQVVHADQAVAEYRRRIGITPAKSGTLLSEQVSALGDQVIQARMARLNAEARLAAFRDGKNNLGNMPEALASATIPSLRSQEATLLATAATLSRNLGDHHPQVMAARAAAAAVSGRIQSELANVAGSLEEQARTARAREAEINRSMVAMRTAVDTGTTNEVELHLLEHEADANRALYDRLLARSRETRVEGGLQQPDAQVVSLAETPRRPTFPNPAVLMPIFFLSSCIATILMVFGLESTDTGFSTIEQVEQTLGLPALGLMPRMRHSWTRRVFRSGQVDRERTAFAESIRHLYTSIMLFGAERAPEVILLTSALPGEGKSSLVLSLARVMARCGKRVVVVDCDLRRPVLHTAFGTERSPGLADVLNGEAELSHVLQADKGSSAALVAAGTAGSYAPDVLGSENMRILLRRLSERFDLILLDSAPVLAVSDTRHLSRLADCTVMVAQWQTTPRKATVEAYRQLRSAGARLPGVVLSVVDLRRYAGHSKLGTYRRWISLYTGK